MLRATSSTRWAAPVGTFGIWALALACAGFWGLKLSAPARGAVFAPPPPAAAAPIDTRLVARALGVPDASATPVASAASRFILQGVVAGRSHRGAALIAVDGRPARPYRVGTLVAPGYVLRSVSPRRATLGRVADDTDSTKQDAGSDHSQDPLVIEMPSLR